MERICLKALFGAEYIRSKPIFWKWTGGNRGYNWPRNAIRDGKWKLMADLKTNKVSLFDMNKKPTERLDEADQYPKVAQTLLNKIKAWDASMPDNPNPACLSIYRNDD